jgi:hypothetical protein
MNPDSNLGFPYYIANIMNYVCRYLNAKIWMPTNSFKGTDVMIFFYLRAKIGNFNLNYTNLGRQNGSWYWFSR